MCFCTQYDSHCGHSWVSLTDPCGFYHDFLNCPRRDIVQMCIAPEGVCPQCFGGFANSETIEMIQRSWGCNQLIRGHIGGAQVNPGQTGVAQLLPQHRRAQPILPGFGFDHRLAGPLAPVSSRLGMVSPQMGMASPYNGMTSPDLRMAVGRASPAIAWYNDGYGDHHDDYYDDRDRKRKHKRDGMRYCKYKHKVKEGGPGCAVM